MTAEWQRYRTATKAAQISHLQNEVDSAQAGFELLQSLSVSASQALELGPVLNQTLHMICDHAGWPIGHVYFREGEVLRPSDMWVVSDAKRFASFRELTMNTLLAPGIGLPGIVALSREPLWIEDMRQHASFPRAQIASALGIGAGFGLPVSARGDVIAVLEFFAPEQAAPDRMLLGFSNFAAILLSALAERLHAEAERNASEIIMKRVVETAQDAFIAIDGAGTIREWNPSAERIFGWTQDEAIGQPLNQLIIPPAYREAHDRGMSRLLSTGESRVLGQRLELPGLRRDGSQVPLEMTISAIGSGSGPLFHAFLRDITERRDAEQALAARQSLLEEAQRLAHIGSWEWDVAHDRVSWSAELFQIFGLDSTAFAATFAGYIDRVHPEDRSLVETKIRSALEGVDEFDFEHRIVRPDKVTRIVHSRGEVERSPNGAPRRLIGSCHDVTELRQVAREAEAVSRRLQTILDTVAEGVYGLAADGTTTFVNRAAAQMLGYTSRELFGALQHEMIHHSRPDGTPYPLEECPIQQTLSDGKIRQSEDDVFWTRDGKSVPVSYVIVPMFENGVVSGGVVTFSDLTERRRTEDEARRALLELVQEQAARAEAESMRGQLHSLFDKAPAHVALTYGPDHVFELANPLFRDFVGGRDVVGKSIREALPEVSAQGFPELLDQVYASGEAYIGNEVPVLLDSADGPGERFFNFVYQPLLGGDSRPYGILVHAVDVTELVLGRKVVERNAVELSRLAAKLERTNRELDQFAYIASHDLKAPLRGVSNIASWLEEDLEGKLTSETHEYIGLMKNRIARMEDLINALLLYSRAGRIQGEPQWTAVEPIIDEVAEMMMEQRPIDIVKGSTFPEVYVDPHSVRQVFQNLIGNAVKYATTKVEVGVVTADSEYQFYVKDDGPGIDPRFHDKIWGMFQRLHAPGEGEGTGIGLAIVKKVIDANHGRAWIESQEGAGSTFWVALPRTQTEGTQDG